MSGYGQQQGMGGGMQRSPFGSNPMQTRPWMQGGYGQPLAGGQDMFAGGSPTFDETGRTPSTTWNPYARYGGVDPRQRTGGMMSQTAPSGVQSSIPPWANQNQPGSQFNTDPSTQRRIVDPFVDYTQSPVTQMPPPVMSKPLMMDPAQGPTMSSPYQASTGPGVSGQFNTDPAGQKMMESNPYGQSGGVDRNSLLNPRAMMDPAALQQFQLGPKPAAMQPGQTDWQINNGSTRGVGGAPGLPQGWAPGFAPGMQQYISSHMAGFTPEQMGQVDWGDILGSVGRITGRPYESVRNIYG